MSDRSYIVLRMVKQLDEQMVRDITIPSFDEIENEVIFAPSLVDTCMSVLS